MDIEQRKRDAKTSIFKAVFPNTTNHYDTMFGGTAMSLMDEVAFITATRFSRKKMVTVSTSKIDFDHPIPHGTIVELQGSISDIGNTSLKVLVNVFVESMYSNDRRLAIKGEFSFVAINENRKPIPVLD